MCFLKHPSWRCFRSIMVNTFHAADVSRRQIKHVTKDSKMSTFGNLVTIFGTTMRNALKIGTNMPGIGLELCEISRILRNKTIFHGWWNQWPRANYYYAIKIISTFLMEIFMKTIMKQIRWWLSHEKWKHEQICLTFYNTK